MACTSVYSLTCMQSPMWYDHIEGWDYKNHKLK